MLVVISSTHVTILVINYKTTQTKPQTSVSLYGEFTVMSFVKFGIRSRNKSFQPPLTRLTKPESLQQRINVLSRNTIIVVIMLSISRHLKRLRRRRKRERHQTIGLMSKNNRSARPLYILVHFLYCHPQNSNVKRSNSGFCGKCEYTTVNFSFSFLT